MALRSGYKGIKKLAAGLKWNRPGILAADDTALAKVFFPRSEQAVLGAKNFLYHDKTSTTAQEGNVTITVYDDKTIKFTGTNASQLFFMVHDISQAEYNYLISISRKWILNGCPEGGNSTGSSRIYGMYFEKTGGAVYDEGKGVEITLPDSYSTPLRVGIVINANQIPEGGLLFKPMISIDGGTYAPYAMTNRELTEKVQSIIDAATNAADL